MNKKQLLKMFKKGLEDIKECEEESPSNYARQAGFAIGTIKGLLECVKQLESEG